MKYQAQQQTFTVLYSLLRDCEDGYLAPSSPIVERGIEGVKLAIRIYRQSLPKTYFIRQMERAIYLRHYKGFTFKEIGKELGVCTERARQLYRGEYKYQRKRFVR